MKTDLIPIRKFLNLFCHDGKRVARTFDLFQRLMRRIEDGRWPLVPREEVNAVELARIWNAVHDRKAEAVQFVSLASLTTPEAVADLKSRYAPIEPLACDALQARLDRQASDGLRTACEDSFSQGFRCDAPDGCLSDDALRFSDLPAALVEDTAGCAVVYATGALIASGTDDTEAYASLEAAANQCFKTLVLGFRKDAIGVLLVLTA